MKYPTYPLNVSESFRFFAFTSIGTKGKFTKIVQFTPLLIPDVYNLSLENFNPETGESDDELITDNGDTATILATVVAAARFFLEVHPNALIEFTGNTLSKTRLYRLAIANNLEELEQDFVILGISDNTPEIFIRNRNYERFVAYLRNKKS